MSSKIGKWIGLLMDYCSRLLYYIPCIMIDLFCVNCLFLFLIDGLRFI